MLERAIENWLTSAGELQYQAAFCHVLMKQGHRILRVSKHRSSEEGKDIVSLDRRGACHAYQLKGGDIDVNAWRAIHGELIDLVSIAVKHPSAIRSNGHRAYLVTNGRLADEVYQRIEDLNRDHAEKGLGYARLEVIERDGLLRQFSDAQDRFLPVEPKGLQQLLSIYLAGGEDLLDKQTLRRVLRDAFFDEPSPPPAKAVNAVTGSVVMLSYLLQPYQRAGNYFAQFEAWATLAGMVEAFALQARVRSAVLATTRELLLGECEAALSALEEEVCTRKDFLEGEIRGDGGLVYKARATVALGAAAALEVQRRMLDGAHQVDGRLVQRLADEREQLWYWGDSAFPFHFAIVRCLELGGLPDIAKAHLETLTRGVATASAAASEAGIPSVYFTVEDVLLAELGIANLPRNARPADFVGQSWSLHNLVLMCARRDMRTVVEAAWAQISTATVYWYEPPDPLAFWEWRPERGTNTSRIFTANESWAELKKIACQPVKPGPILKSAAPLVLFHLLVRPERALSQIVAALDGQLVRQRPKAKKRIKTKAR